MSSIELVFGWAIFWGVWLLVPMLIDGLTTVASLIGVLIMARRRKTETEQGLGYYPQIGIVIPVFNSQVTLEACLRSLAEQDYPLERMNIILVNNGSSDRSFQIFARLQMTLGLQLHWHTIINQGKAWALNAGIHLSHGTYIVNVDSDVVLAPDAIRKVVEALESDPELGAVTGAVQVLPALVTAPHYLKILAECEFFEYLTAFNVGREHQTLLRSLYTLSGAFSAFRRDILLQTYLFSQETVTEDTDLTFEIYERFKNYRMGCVSQAVAYTHPVDSIGRLYAQRVRWQRGQMEVSARHTVLMKRSMLSVRGFAPARTLAIDHTLAFPRIVWTFLLPALALWGYPLSLIVMSLGVMYLYYVLIDILWIFVSILSVNQVAKSRLKRTWRYVPLLPLYRMLIFWFRFSGFLYAIAEPGVWRVEEPWVQIRTGLREIRSLIQA